MCLGIPGRLIERKTDSGGVAWGTVEFAGVHRQVCLACVPDAGVGDYVVVHAGLAISRIDAEEAQRVFELILQLEPEAVDEIRR
jgi:hydrogenase expression/formation protein HypC